VADPIPVNSRRDRNPPQPTPPPTPFGRPQFGVGLPPRPFGAQAGDNAPAANPFQRAPLPPQAPAAPRPQGRLGGVLPPAEPRPGLLNVVRDHVANTPPPLNIVGNPFARAAAATPAPARRQRLPRLGDRGTLMLVGMVFVMIVLGRIAAEPAASVSVAYSPRNNLGIIAPVNVAAAASLSGVLPTMAAEQSIASDWRPAGVSSGITAAVIARTLIRACPHVDCLALRDPTILEIEQSVDISAIDASRTWVKVNILRANGVLGSGWLSIDVIRASGSLYELPVMAN